MTMIAIACRALSLVAVLAAQAAAQDPPLTVAPLPPPLTAMLPVPPLTVAPPLPPPLPPMLAAAPMEPAETPATAVDTGIITSPSTANETAAAPEEASATENLANTLFVTFFCVFVGYLTVQMGLIQPQRGDLIGLGFYVGTIGLPILVFHICATAEFADMDMSVILVCFLARFAVMCVTWVAVYLVYRSHRGQGQRILSAGILSFFVTASNDFAVGLPVIKALYSGAMFKYIAANALVSNAVLTPIAMVGLAIGTNMKKQEDDALADTSQPKPPDSAMKMVRTVGRDILLNPIMTMAIVGFLFKVLLGKVALHEVDGKQHFISPMDQAVGALMKPFGTLALFLTGASLQRPKIQFWPAVLVLMKVVICAYCTYALAVWMVGPNANDPTAETRLQDFSFIYGMLPANSAPLIFARQFDPEAASLVATAILFGLVVAGPLMFGAAVFLEGVSHIGRLLHSMEYQAAGTSVVCYIFILAMLLVLREDWGYSDPFKFIIAGYFVVGLTQEVLTMLMNPHIAGDLCVAFQEQPTSTLGYAVMRSVTRQACRNLILLIIVMMTTNRFVPAPADQSAMHGLKLFLAVIAVSCVTGFFTAPNSHDLCSHHTLATVHYISGTRDEENGGLTSIIHVLYLIVFCSVTLLWAVRGAHKHAIVANASFSSKSDSSSEEEESEEDWDFEKFEEDPRTGDQVKTWRSKPPKSVIQGLASVQVVLIAVGFVNVVLHRFGMELKGSYAMMLVVEVLLKHASGVILLGLLTANMSFAQLFMRKAQLVFPCLSSEPEEDDEAGGFQGSGVVGNLYSMGARPVRGMRREVNGFLRNITPKALLRA